MVMMALVLLTNRRPKMSRLRPLLRNYRQDVMIMAIIGSFAGLLLFWNLGGKYLWQDEAATGILAERLLRYGKPMSYDGTNLVTIDYYAAEDLDTIEERSANPAVMIDYYSRRGDFKRDMTWTWQPWGQFIVAAAALKLFGHDAAGMRLPFALASLLTLWLFYYLVRRQTGSVLLATLATALLTANCYWILDGRQCRYYALSCLCFVLLLLAYARWRRAERYGAVLFVVADWCFFQVDYGSVLPISLVLFAYTLLTDSKRRRETFYAGTAFAASIAPFFFYYGMNARLAIRSMPLNELFWSHFFNLNQYILPVVVMLAAVLLLKLAGSRVREEERHLVSIALWLVPAMLFWLTMVTPTVFLRYCMVIAPVGAFLIAWTFVRGSEWLWPERNALCATAACAFSLFIAVSPWASKPAGWLVPKLYRGETGTVVRAELSRLYTEVFGHEPDPNRLLVEWLKANAAPTDEIMINYEELPLVFYLPNPIRGGIGAFRVRDNAKTAPRFAILRPSVWFVFWPTYEHEVKQFRWETLNVNIPDVVWGNNPDPNAHTRDPVKPRNVFIARRVDEEVATTGTK